MRSEVDPSVQFGKETQLTLINPQKWDDQGPDQDYPGRGDFVKIHYSVYVDGDLGAGPFDTSRGHESPFEFQLGSAKVIAGLERAVQHMRVGARVEVLIPSNLAYGSQGAGGGVVPPYADLVFDIELMAFGKPEEVSNTNKRAQQEL